MNKSSILNPIRCNNKKTTLQRYYVKKDFINSKNKADGKNSKGLSFSEFLAMSIEENPITRLFTRNLIKRIYMEGAISKNKKNSLILHSASFLSKTKMRNSVEFIIMVQHLPEDNKNEHS